MQCSSSCQDFVWGTPQPFTSAHWTRAPLAEQLVPYCPCTILSQHLASFGDTVAIPDHCMHACCTSASMHARALLLASLPSCI